MRSTALKLLALASSLIAPLAHADDVTFAGYANGSQTVTYSLSGLNPIATGTVRAGGFSTSLNGGPSFETYCVDLFHFIGFGVTYSDYSAPGTSHAFVNPRAYTDLGRLYSTAGLVNTPTLEAAFQIAVWEIAYEAALPYALGTGDATFANASDPGALTQASFWLTHLSATGVGIGVLESRNHQDVITPVPEPETYALMLAGLGALGWMQRRRKALLAA